MTTREAVDRLTARNTDIDLWPYLIEDGGALDVDNCPDCWERDAHIERYLFACKVLAGVNDILDFGCGVGYGTELLRTVSARSVHGVDQSFAALARARERRGGLPGVKFSAGMSGNVFGSRYNACTAFEVIEHLDDTESFIDSAPARHLVCSSPIVPTVGMNPHHKHDFTDESFRRLVERRFDIKWWFHQYRPYAQKPSYLVIHGEAR